NFERRGVRRARGYLLAAISAARRQATDLPSPKRLNFGTVSLQVVVAWAQRVRNKQPEGRLIALGSSPESTTLFLRASRRMDGVAAMRASVYGCGGGGNGAAAFT